MADGRLVCLCGLSVLLIILVDKACLQKQKLPMGVSGAQTSPPHEPYLSRMAG